MLLKHSYHVDYFYTRKGYKDPVVSRIFILLSLTKYPTCLD